MTIPAAVISIDADNFRDETALHTIRKQVQTHKQCVPLIRVYGNAAMLQANMETFSHLGAELVPNLPLDKNTTDMSLAVDAMHMCCTGVRFIAIVSGDRDFIPLAIRLRRLGCTVWNFSLSVNSYSKMHEHYDKVCVFQDGKMRQSAISNQQSAARFTQILRAYPDLSSGKPVPLSRLVHELREKNVIGKTEKLASWLRPLSAYFDLMPKEKPNYITKK